MKRQAFAVVMIIGLTLAGCSQKEEAKPKEHTSEEHMHVSGDIAEKTADLHTLPKFLSSQPEQVQQIYTIAGQNYELLASIPCYCGCGESAGHTSNKSCFIREVKENGEVIWDSHATTCVNCMEIALESASMKQNGSSALEIRNYIDNKYKEGYGKPTPTPMPAS
ncbi:PCYCGC motif-containing (lipo)protein [Ectobacillus panaciterrae]|uniref:PCYCGC motif-containing (lipo)protein n=1 Tax=Ectobacillus panaciterrae TaxID=363872 RepID=UPI0004178E83|nr:PCYCGC motif-containing (lipo)protein [Ectobacillus panaciterrae]